MKKGNIAERLKLCLCEFNPFFFLLESCVNLIGLGFDSQKA